MGYQQLTYFKICSLKPRLCFLNITKFSITTINLIYSLKSRLNILNITIHSFALSKCILCFAVNTVRDEERGKWECKDTRNQRFPLRIWSKDPAFYFVPSSPLWQIPPYSHKWNPAAAKQPWWLCGISSTWLWWAEKNPQPDPDLQTISIERGCDTKNN